MTDEEDDRDEEEVEVDEEGVEDVDEHDVAGPGTTVLTYFGTDFDIHGLVRRLENGDVVVPTFDPSQDTGSGLEGFQRRFVWRKPQMDRFIESLLLGYPVPGIFLVQGPDKRLLVLDGQQRLRTLHAFISNLYRENPYVLENVGDQFHRLSYPKLPDDMRREFDNTFIHATIVRHDESPEGYRGVYQLFERLNTGGTNLQPQEIRVALFHGRYVELLRALNEVPEWRDLYGKRSERLKDQELILRYLAMLHDRAEYSRPLKIFLNDFLDRNQDASAKRCKDDRELFTSAVQLISSDIGPRAFRPVRNLNAAFVEAVLVGVAERLRSGGTPPKEGELESAFDALVADDAFLRTTTASTAGEEVLADRLTRAIAAFGA